MADTDQNQGAPTPPLPQPSPWHCHHLPSLFHPQPGSPQGRQGQGGQWAPLAKQSGFIGQLLSPQLLAAHRGSPTQPARVEFHHPAELPGTTWPSSLIPTFFRAWMPLSLVLKGYGNICQQASIFKPFLQKPALPAEAGELAHRVLPAPTGAIEHRAWVLGAHAQGEQAGLQEGTSNTR